MLLEADVGALPPVESDLGALLVESDLGAPLVESGLEEPVSEADELASALLAPLPDRFEGPEYRSDSQPPPFRMKPPPPIMRRALNFPHSGHFLIGFSVMRCSRSNSWPQLSQV